MSVTCFSLKNINIITLLAGHPFVSLFALPDYPFTFSCLFLQSNGSVVPSMLIKIDAEAQIDQRQLVAFMNNTLKSGALGKYQVDPSSVQSTGIV